MNISYKLYKLKEIPLFINKIADIYLKNWGWYYKEEHNIDTINKMIEYIYGECMDFIYLILSDNYDLIASVMLTIDEDLSKLGNCPLLSYLYINDDFKEYEHEYSSILIENLSKKEEIYTWCYCENDQEKYLKLGFFKYHQYDYNNNKIIILKKPEFVNR